MFRSRGAGSIRNFVSVISGCLTTVFMVPRMRNTNIKGTLVRCMGGVCPRVALEMCTGGRPSITFCRGRKFEFMRGRMRRRANRRRLMVG